MDATADANLDDEAVGAVGVDLSGLDLAQGGRLVVPGQRQRPIAGLLATGLAQFADFASRPPAPPRISRA